MWHSAGTYIAPKTDSRAGGWTLVDEVTSLTSDISTDTRKKDA
jgi:hypothetical protein